MSVTGNIDLVEKYGPSMQARFEAQSYTLNKVATDWTFDEANRIKMKSYVLDEPNKGYPSGPREGGDRLGTPKDVVDVTQILELGESVFWSVTMDATDQARGSLHKAGEYMRERNNQMDIPQIDKDNLRKWALHAGTTIQASAAMGKTTIIEQILDIEAAMDEENVPQENRWCYCPVSYRKYVRLADEWDACDGIMNGMVLKGWEGKIGSMQMVFVPTKLMPKNIELLGVQQDAVIAPNIYQLARILTEQRGIPGSVLEFLKIYDAFVKGIKQVGVVAVVKYGASAKASVTVTNPATANSGQPGL